MANYNIKLSNIWYHWHLSMANEYQWPFPFCETCYSTKTIPFLCNMQWISMVNEYQWSFHKNGMTSFLIPFVWNMFTTHQTVRGQQECDFSILGRTHICIICVRNTYTECHMSSWHIYRVCGWARFVSHQSVTHMSVSYAFVTHT